MFNYYQIALTKFIDYNIYTENPFEEQIVVITDLDKGEVVDP